MRRRNRVQGCERTKRQRGGKKKKKRQNIRDTGNRRSCYTIRPAINIATQKRSIVGVWSRNVPLGRERLVSPSHIMLWCTCQCQEEGNNRVPVHNAGGKAFQSGSRAVKHKFREACTNLHGGRDVGEGESFKVGK